MLNCFFLNERHHPILSKGSHGWIWPTSRNLLAWTSKGHPKGVHVSGVQPATPTVTLTLEAVHHGEMLGLLECPAYYWCPEQHLDGIYLETETP